MTTPSIEDFVLYAERGVRLGRHCRVSGGDVGVHAVAEGSFGIQTQIGDATTIELERGVFSPSLSLGRDVEIGAMETNVLWDNGIPLGPLAPFPASEMPPLPLAPAPAAGEQDVDVGVGDVVTLTPGSYAEVSLSGTLALKPGDYTFSTVTIGDRARLLAIEGDVRICIRGSLSTGREVEISPALSEGAAGLVIFVAAGDLEGVPAASLGERSRIRALLVAPKGSVCFADSVYARGAFAGFDIALGEDVRVDFESGLPVLKGEQSGSQRLQGYYGPHPDPSVAPLVELVPADTLVPLNIGLPVRDPQGLQAFIEEVSDPASPTFRKHLTQAEFSATYGATDADYASLESWARARGFTIDATYPNRLLLGVSAPAVRVEQALFVKLVYRLRADGSKFVAVDREPSLDLAAEILYISGLADFRTPQPAAVHGTGPKGYKASDLRNAYLGPTQSLLSLTGAGQTIGLFELETFMPSDVEGYDSLQEPPLNSNNVTVQTVQGPPIFTSYSVGPEVVLDIAMAQAMAPAAEVIVFLGATQLTGQGDAILHAMATSTPALSCASCSWTFGRNGNSQQALDQMAAQGVSFFTSSGDNGDVGDPQSNQNMNNQTLVGGTFLQTEPLSSPPPNATYPANYYMGENTWNTKPTLQQNGVTGGGIMDGNNQNGNCHCWPYSVGPFPGCCGAGVPIPGYQLTIMQASAAGNGGSTAWRNYPDVAMVAESLEIFFEGRTEVVGGTSASTPLWAGFIALVNQAITQSDPSAGLAGFVNPTLYDIGLTRGTTLDLYAACFNDINDGVSNANGFGAGFVSVPGYDLCTGLGSPKPTLITQLASPTPTDSIFTVIRFVIGTGHDNLRGNGGFLSGCQGSGATADVMLPGGGVFTVTLKPTDTDESWEENTSTGPLDFQIPNVDNNGNPVPVLTATQGIAGVRVNLLQGNFTAPCGADNWDIASLSVSLVAPTLTIQPLCQLNLVGTATLQDGQEGLVRLSETAGSGGSGPSSPVFNTGAGSGCP